MPQIVDIVLAAAGGERQNRVVRRECAGRGLQPVGGGNRIEKRCSAQGRRVGIYIIKRHIGEKHRRNLKHHILAVYGEENVRILLHKCGIREPMELGKALAVDLVTVALRVAVDDRVFHQVRARGEIIPAVGIITAPLGVIPQLVQL